jgi:hypothetical protein
VSAYDQTKGELCDKCGWAMKFPDEPCRCELERENKQLRQTVLETLNQRGQRELIVAWDRVKELERENTALRAALEQQANYQRDLRADRDRLDWLDAKIVSSWLDGKDFVVWDKSSPQPCSIREWLDSARKGAQP